MKFKIVKFEKVTALFQSLVSTVAAANRLDLAYWVSEGKPGSHKSFDENNPQEVAQSIAGLYAADTAANIIATVRGGLSIDGKISEAWYTETLNEIADGKLNGVEELIVKNVANVAWRSGQPFRDMATNPLNRITRSINMQFNQLPTDEENKDLVQVVEGAKILLELAEEVEV